MPEPFTVLIMAAGRGTRMRSGTPKVLHRVCGKPMVEWVIDAARAAGAGRVVCVVRPGEGVREGLPENVDTVEQTEGEGTGSAVLAAGEAVDDGPLVVLSGDQPLITAEQIGEIVEEHRRAEAGVTLLTTEELDPTGYGRIVRDEQGAFERIVETKYEEGVPPEELAIREVNLGTYVFEAPNVFAALAEVKAGDSGERYLTDVLPLVQADGATIATHSTDDVTTALGVNDRVDLMDAEQLAQRRILEHHAREGVTFLHPGTARVEAGVTIGSDTTIGPGVSLLGSTRVGGGCNIVQAYVVDAEIGDGALIGPFAYVRPGTVIGDNAKVGTFVEIKNSDIGAGAKVPHLSYLGDADVGEAANVGASTITANYDGRRKHRTKLGKSAKTGIHTSLVAPVDVGERAYTGAGSVITGDVPDGALGIARSKQRNVEGYADRVEEDSK